jgi:hypothetical protein
MVALDESFPNGNRHSIGFFAHLGILDSADILHAGDTKLPPDDLASRKADTLLQQRPHKLLLVAVEDRLIGETGGEEGTLFGLVPEGIELALETLPDFLDSI